MVIEYDIGGNPLPPQHVIDAADAVCNRNFVVSGDDLDTRKCVVRILVENGCCDRDEAEKAVGIEVRAQVRFGRPGYVITNREPGVPLLNQSF